VLNQIMPEVKRAIIPCGGKGTRMASLTGGRAKELMPLAGRPQLLWVLAECAASGISDVLVVASPNKHDLIDVARGAAGKPDMPARIESVIQREPRGLADAIRHGHAFTAGEPFGVALPDNVFVADVPALRQVVQSHQQTKKNVVGVVELFPQDAERAGPTAIYRGHVDHDLYIIDDIPPKGSHGATFDLEGAPSGFTGIGRYVFLPEFFATTDEIEKKLPGNAEVDDVPVMRLLLERNRLVGRRIVGKFFDVGLPVGYQEANERLAMRGMHV
jgi:UTP--glucose-1-phosphate uridylyltransferase